MSKQPPSAPGFALPPANPQHSHGYSPIQQQPGYSTSQPAYPAYPQAPQQYPQQPFPAPIQYNQQQQPPSAQYATGDLSNYFAGATAFNVIQKIELLEAIIGWETSNKYSVKDQAGNKIFYVGEETGCLSRICCGQIRPFLLNVKNNSGQTVMTFSRELDCGSVFCGFCCADEVKVTTPTGLTLGTIQEEGSCLYPCFKIKSANGQTVLRIEGPLCVCGHVSFQILDLNDVQVGSIKKEWGGIVRELVTDADIFSVTFPPNIDVTTKATLLGALFMIDFHYFERSGNKWGQGGRRLFS